MAMIPTLSLAAMMLLRCRWARRPLRLICRMMMTLRASEAEFPFRFAQPAISRLPGSLLLRAPGISFQDGLFHSRRLAATRAIFFFWRAVRFWADLGRLKTFPAPTLSMPRRR